jgi:hypothetical protein
LPNPPARDGGAKRPGTKPLPNPRKNDANRAKGQIGAKSEVTIPQDFMDLQLKVSFTFYGIGVLGLLAELS